MMSTSCPRSSSSSYGISFAKAPRKAIKKSSVALMPIGVFKSTLGTLHFFSSSSAASMEAKCPKEIVIREFPASLTSSSSAPPLGYIAKLPVIGESTTPEVSGNMWNGTSIKQVRRLISRISPGLTKPGKRLTCSFLNVPVASQKYLTMAFVMLEKPVI